MSDSPQAAPPPPAKEDPATLVLRAAPPQVVRFRRGLIIAATGTAAAVVIAAAWYALSPPSLQGLVPVAADRIDRAAPAPTVLADAPGSYGEVPQLGPPLPGDLGQPILAHQRALEAEGASAEGMTAADAERKAARESAILLPVGRGAVASNAQPVMLNSIPVSNAEAVDGMPGEAREASHPGEPSPRVGDGSTVNPHRLVAVPSPWTLQAGSVIAASLITGINSDLPGLVTAQVSESVHDSLTGRTLLIPQGARLIGRYDSAVAFGQRRALILWQRLILPDGSSIRLDDVPASDTQGFAGLADRVDQHGGELLKGVAMASVLGVGTELTFGDGEGNLLRALRDSAQQSGARAGEQIVGRALGIKPTIRVRPGWPLRVVVQSDLVLSPWRDGGE